MIIKKSQATTETALQGSLTNNIQHFVLRGRLREVPVIIAYRILYLQLHSLVLYNWLFLAGNFKFSKSSHFL